MAKKKGNRTISIYFRKGVWEKIKRVKYPGKLVNRLLEKHYDLLEEETLKDSSMAEIERLKDELEVSKYFIRKFMSAYDPNRYSAKGGFYDIEIGRQTAKEVLRYAETNEYQYESERESNVYRS